MARDEGPRADDLLRLTGSAGSNRIMEAELLRVVKRSPFRVRLPKARREGDATLLFPFGPEIAWTAACWHRTSSRIAWELWSSPADRLEPLFADLVPLIASDARLDPPQARRLGISVEVRASEDFAAGPLQLRGTVKNAIVEGLARRGVEAELRPDDADLHFAVRRTGEDARRTCIALDIGGGARHRRGERVAMVDAPMRETLAAQLVMFSRWDARTEALVDPMTGGGTIAVEAAHLAVGHPVRRAHELPGVAAFADMPRETPDLFPGTVPRILACDVADQAIKALVGNLRASGLTGLRAGSLVLRQRDVRELTPAFVDEALPGASSGPGVIVMNPPYGERLHAGGDAALLALYEGAGRACARFRGWRVAVFVAHDGFRDAFARGLGRGARIVKPASNAQLRGWMLLFS